MITDSGTIMNGNTIVESIIVTDNNIFVYHTERTNNVAVAEFCFGINDS